MEGRNPKCMQKNTPAIGNWRFGDMESPWILSASQNLRFCRTWANSHTCFILLAYFILRDAEGFAFFFEPQ